MELSGQSPAKINIQKKVITYPDSIDPDELFEILSARLIGRFAFQQMEPDLWREMGNYIEERMPIVQILDNIMIDIDGVERTLRSILTEHGISIPVCKFNTNDDGWVAAFLKFHREVVGG